MTIQRIFGIPVVNPDGPIHNCIRSIRKYCPEDKIWLIDNTPNRDLKRKVVTYSWIGNIGGNPMSVASSWNAIGAAFLDCVRRRWDETHYLYIANDDIEMYPDTMPYFEMKHIVDLKPVITLPEDTSWSLFRWDVQRAVETVGFFDEAFYPAYWEDFDYAYRLNLYGIPPYISKAPHVHLGSQTIKQIPEEEMEERHHRYFRKNRAYYKAKWGTEETSGGYTRPFEGYSFE